MLLVKTLPLWVWSKFITPRLMNLIVPKSTKFKGPKLYLATLVLTLLPQC